MTTTIEILAVIAVLVFVLQIHRTGLARSLRMAGFVLCATGDACDKATVGFVAAWQVARNEFRDSFRQCVMAADRRAE